MTKITVAEESTRRSGIRYFPFLVAASALAALRFDFRVSSFRLRLRRSSRCLSRTGGLLLSKVVRLMFQTAYYSEDELICQ
jgi:hypothetical protein